MYLKFILFLHTQILLNQYKLEVYDLFHIMLQRLCLLFGRIRLPESGQKNDIITWEKFWEASLLPLSPRLRKFNDIYYQRGSQPEDNPHSSTCRNRSGHKIATSQSKCAHRDLPGRNSHRYHTSHVPDSSCQSDHEIDIP